MLLVGAIVLAIYAVDGTWAVVLIGAAAAVEVSQSLFWIWYSKRKRPQVGVETLVGSVAEVVRACTPAGLVRVQGEIWQARCKGEAGEGARVRVIAVNGLILEVEPLAG